NLPSWMFLSSFESFRDKFLKQQTIISLTHLGRGIFGPDFGTVAFVIMAEHPCQSKAIYRRLFDRHVQVRSPDEIERLFLEPEQGKFIQEQSEFSKIPGSPIAYWVSEKIVSLFENEEHRLGAHLELREGINTGDNERFLRLWHEVDDSN